MKVTNFITVIQANEKSFSESNNKQSDDDSTYNPFNSQCSSDSKSHNKDIIKVLTNVLSNTSSDSKSHNKDIIKVLTNVLSNTSKGSQLKLNCSTKISIQNKMLNDIIDDHNKQNTSNIILNCSTKSTYTK